jgi:hypothetical protein
MILHICLLLWVLHLCVSVAPPAPHSKQGLRVPLSRVQVEPDNVDTTCVRLASEVLRSIEPAQKSTRTDRVANELAACVAASQKGSSRGPLFVAGKLQVAEDAPRLALTALSHLLLSIPTLSPSALKPDVQHSRTRFVPMLHLLAFATSSFVDRQMTKTSTRQ